MAEICVALHYTPAQYYALTIPEYLAIREQLSRIHSANS